MSLKAGDVVGKRYMLTRPIAMGGMGAVWSANDQVLGRNVAVKLLKPEYSSDKGFLARFRSEARHSAGLSHPNIAAVYDYGEANDTSAHSGAYLVMEEVPGAPLSTILNDQGRLPPDRVLDILAQTASGLGAAHAKGIVHRDVKPANLLITPDGQVKITDFGIARAIDQASLTATGTVMGTARYLAPEQATGEPTSPASDLYSLGVVGYEALAGHSPFTAETPVAQAMAHVHDTPQPLPGDVPAAVADLVMGLLAKDPLARPTNGRALVDLVNRVRGGEHLAMTQQNQQLPPPVAPTQATAVLGHGGGVPATAAMPAHQPPTQYGQGYPPAPYTQGQGGPGGGYPQPPRRKRGIWTVPLMALVAIVLFVVAAYLFNVFTGDVPEDPTQTETTTVTHTPSPTTETTSETTTQAPTTEPTTQAPTQQPTTQAPTQEPTQEPTEPQQTVPPVPDITIPELPENNGGDPAAAGAGLTDPSPTGSE